MNVEGRNAVGELIKTDATIDVVYVQNGMRDAPSRELLGNIKSAGIKVSFVDKAVLDKQSVTKKHQGFIASISDYVYADFDDIVSNLGENAFVVVLDGVEDVHNLASIIRVCECGGVDALVIGKHRSACVNETVMRISEGSANHVQIARVVNINQAIDKLKENGVWVYGLELGGENIYQTDFSGKIAIVVGGEDTGINKLTKSKCDKLVTIPMHGKINSLNASVATGVAVFEVARQKLNK
jgi:23S rRNA (guanosine2251-2'-O)-methyltransferase